MEKNRKFLLAVNISLNIIRSLLDVYITEKYFCRFSAILTLHKKMKFSIKDFFSKFGQICRKQNSEFIITGGINRPRAIFFPFSETGILLVIPKVRKIGTHLRL